MKISLSGIKSTGTPHLGNYLGMIKPAIDLQKDGYETYYFIANYHALTTVRDAKQMLADTMGVAATFLAFGLDPAKGALFRQSDIPEIPELFWLLSCAVSMGDLTRAHAYKAAKDRGEEGTLNLGVFGYPVLMAADILAYDSDVVPVGKDQLQHVEMAREIARRFNFHFGDTFKEPKDLVRPEVAVIPGLDGRKMSKSYNNGIEPLADAKTLKKQVMAIVTDSKGLDDVKDPDTCNIFQLYKLVATADEVATMAEKYRKGGFGYGHAKLALLEKFEAEFGPARAKYQELMSNPQQIETALVDGARKARAKASVVLKRARKACGLE